MHALGIFHLLTGGFGSIYLLMFWLLLAQHVPWFMPDWKDPAVTSFKILLCTGLPSWFIRLGPAYGIPRFAVEIVKCAIFIVIFWPFFAPILQMNPYAVIAAIATLHIDGVTIALVVGLITFFALLPRRKS